MKAEFTVIGQPEGKGRPRFTRYGHPYTPQKTVDYENLIKAEYMQQCRGIKFSEEAMLRMFVKAYLGIPKSASKKARLEMEAMVQRPAKKPDLDNILKVVADALNELAYHDDKQIVSASIEKYYSEEPRLEIVIDEIK
jgi:Holliday junction resolvase RusA-like endonuclease